MWTAGAQVGGEARGSGKSVFCCAFCRASVQQRNSAGQARLLCSFLLFCYPSFENELEEDVNPRRAEGTEDRQHGVDRAASQAGGQRGRKKSRSRCRDRGVERRSGDISGADRSLPGRTQGKAEYELMNKIEEMKRKKRTRAATMQESRLQRVWVGGGEEEEERRSQSEKGG